ncbi:MAG: hypothetical protein EYC62_05115 [Alphaproteobacteria bacterium]|nr:MAG: hypothetical protein EYC62_05115 [Alphaproteobacteria bacterium]
MRANTTASFGTPTFGSETSGLPTPIRDAAVTFVVLSLAIGTVCAISMNFSGHPAEPHNKRVIGYEGNDAPSKPADAADKARLERGSR